MFIIHFLKEQAMRKLNLIIKFFKKIIFFLLILFSESIFSHEGHSHGPSVVASVAFDQSGTLWRVREQQGFVVIDSSNDQGLNFSKSINVNMEPQQIGVSGEAKPKIAIGPEGNIYVTWTQALSKPYSGYIWFVRSKDHGKTFELPQIVHQDKSEITHRFDGINVNKNGRIFIAWIDKRDVEKAKLENKAKEYEGAGLYYAVSENFGESFKIERKILDNSCECCRISLTNDSAGNVVAMWRQIYEKGIRDHAIAKIDTKDKIILNRATFGGWKIDACPHHGPAIAKGGDWGYHMAWFDGGNKVGLFYARMDGEAWVSSPPKRFGNTNFQPSHPSLLSINEKVYLAWKEINEFGNYIVLSVSEDGGKNWLESKLIKKTDGVSDYPELIQFNNKVFLSWNTIKNGYQLISLE